MPYCTKLDKKDGKKVSASLRKCAYMEMDKNSIRPYCTKLDKKDGKKTSASLRKCAYMEMDKNSIRTRRRVRNMPKREMCG